MDPITYTCVAANGRHTIQPEPVLGPEMSSTPHSRFWYLVSATRRVNVGTLGWQLDA